MLDVFILTLFYELYVKFCWWSPGREAAKVIHAVSEYITVMFITEVQCVLSVFNSVQILQTPCALSVIRTLSPVDSTVLMEELRQSKRRKERGNTERAILTD